MIITCPKCNTENPSISWFCSGCGASLKAQNHTPNQNTGFKIEPTIKKIDDHQVKVEKINGTNFPYLLNYAITLDFIANVILALSIIGVIAGIWVSIKIGGRVLA